MKDDQRSAMYNSWKEENDKKVKKCNCTEPEPRPTDLNSCFNCKGEIYKDYLDKIRHYDK